MTFDSDYELKKIHKYFPEAEAVLRIITDDSQSVCQFGKKFGAHMKDIPAILDLAVQLKMKIAGVSFHVGSGCSKAYPFGKALRDAQWVFAEGEKRGLKMNLVDIGGGFQGSERDLPTLEEVAKEVNPELDKFPPGTEFISEPGRYFVFESQTLVVSIFAKRKQVDDEGKVRFLYYINEGLYHNFNCVVYDYQSPMPIIFKPKEGQLEGQTYDTMIFGPTCDSLDCVVKDKMLPEMFIGQTLVFERMGAYTNVAATHFNGFPPTEEFIYLTGEKTEKLMRQPTRKSVATVGTSDAFQSVIKALSTTAPVA
jgi:ornithine decarboxylase